MSPLFTGLIGNHWSVNPVVRSFRCWGPQNFGKEDLLLLLLPLVTNVMLISIPTCSFLAKGIIVIQ